MKIMDCATPVTAEEAKKIKADGFDGVARYIVPTVFSKALTKQEAINIGNADLGIILCWETTATRSGEGASAASQDAPILLQCLKDVGVPEGNIIYPTSDYDVPVDQYPAVERYYRGMSANTTGYEIGGYCKYDLMNTLGDLGIIKRGWQPAAWSGGKWSKYAVIRQVQNGIMEAGIEADLDLITGDCGLWYPVKQPVFPDVTPDRWSYPAIVKCKDAGLMSGYPDGTFKPDQPVTREELASILSTLIGGK